MPVEFFYPFTVTALTAEFTPTSTGVSVMQDGAFDAFTDEPDEIRIDVKAHIDGKFLTQLLPPDTDPGVALAAAVVVQSKEGRNRLAHHLSGSPGNWSGMVTLRRSQWRGPVDLYAKLHLSGPLPASDGKAADKGAAVAWSERTRVFFDERDDQPSGRSLRIDWIHFKEDPELVDDHIFAMRPDPGGPPVILLNLDFENAYAVLDSRGTHGPKARVRDATFQIIVHQCWTSILTDAWGSLVQIPRQAESPMEELPSWKREVLVDWCVDLFPGTDTIGAQAALIEAAQGGDISDMVTRGIPTAIQSRLSTSRGFSGLVKEIAAFGITGEGG
ncbi:MAG: hypothetical protein ACYDHU_09740 [Acidimicrobiales bacterium]